MVLASLLLLLVALLVCLAYLWRRPGEGLGLPLIAVLTFTYEYVVQSVQLTIDGRLDIFLNEAQTAKAFLLPALMLPCFLWGWFRGQKAAAHRQPRPSQHPSWNARRVWGFGCSAAFLGLAIYGVFLLRSGGILQAYSGVHGQAMAWRENTAYLYSTTLWVLSGSAMMVAAAWRFQLGSFRKLVPLLVLGLSMANAILLASRGLLFATGATLLVSQALAKRLPLTVSRGTPSLLALSVGVLLMLGYRDVLHLGAVKPEPPSFSTALAAGATVNDTHTLLRMAGTEFIYHALVLDTVDKKQKYHLGINWFWVYTIAPIPRIWWPEKPYGFNTPGITWDDIVEVTGIRIAAGSAPGIVADIYSHFGLLSPLFFFLFGKFSARLFHAARAFSSPLSVCAYVMLYAASLNCFGQGFGAILVSFPFSLAPPFAYTLFRQLLPVRSRRRTPSPTALHLRPSPLGPPSGNPHVG